MANIIFITGTDPKKYGGVNQVVQGYAKALSSNNKVHIIYGWGENGYLGKMPKLWRKFDLWLAPFLLKTKLKNVLKSNRIDIVHAHGIDAIYDTALLKNWLQKNKIKTVATLHGLDLEVLRTLTYELLHGKILLSPLSIFHLAYFSLSVLKERFAYPKMDYLFAVSPGIKEKLKCFYKLYAEFLPNGLSQAKPANVYSRHKLGIKSEAKVVLFIGVSSWLKGFNYFKKIINKKYSFIVVGIKLPKSLLRRWSNIVNIPHASPGEITDLLRLADVLVHTSLSEAFGLVYLEAFAEHLPIVSFRNDGTNLLIKNNVNGLLAPLRDHKTLQAKIELILNKPLVAKNLARKAYLELPKYSYRKNAVLLANYYHNILKGKNILLIPHIVKNNIRSRTEEMARALARAGNNVYLLSWGERRTKSYGLNLINLFYFFTELLRRPKIVNVQGIKKLHLPRLVYPLGLATQFNSWLVNFFIKFYKIEKVVNAAFLYYQIKPGNFIYIYDFVDDHIFYTRHNQRSGSGKLADRMQEYIDLERNKADKLIFVNNFLLNKYQLSGKNCQVINNGAFFADYAFDPRELKTELGLTGKFIYGLIGNHGEWSGIKTLIEIFKKNKNILKNSLLLIIGPVYAPKLVKNLPANILYLGQIAPEKINKYYSLCDVGLQAADDDEFRKMTFPLKVIEFTAAKKIVLALESVNIKNIDLPNLVVSARQEKNILGNLLKVQHLKWQESWNKIIAKFDWQDIISKL